jgi:hypothetical protein
MLRRTIFPQETAMSFAPETDAVAKPQTLMRVPVGFASPLWGLFAGAAVTGAAWWWMTRWTRPQNLEAMLGAAAKTETALEAKAEALAAPAADVAEAAFEAAQTSVEAAPEAVAETVVEPMIEAEAAAEPAAEAFVEAAEVASPVPVLEELTDAAPDLEPVGGEAAPISPVLEALAAEPEAAVAAEAPEALVADAVAAPAAKARKKAAAPKAD